jgi:anti-sigma factor RsiW
VTCRECSEFLSDYLDGELEASVRATFDQHLSLCPNCVTYLEQFAATIRAGRLAFADDDASGECPFPEELIQAILAARRADPSARPA